MVIKIAHTLFIFIRMKNFTKGCSNMAIITAKTMGTIMLLATYKIVIKAIKPRNRMDAFAYNGNFNLSSVTAIQYSFLFYGRIVEIKTVRMI